MVLKKIRHNLKYLLSLLLFYPIYLLLCNESDHFNENSRNNFLHLHNKKLNNKFLIRSPEVLQLNKGVCSKGEEPWEKQWIINELKQFLQVFENRLAENEQGTPIMHQFALWCIVRHLKPNHIIESGIWRGLGTWIIRQASPNSQIILLDPKETDLLYKDTKNDTIYFTGSNFRDLGSLRYWTDVDINFSETLVFVDDHNTPFKRIPQARRVGVKHMIFEDNYWLGYSDCLSLKQGCACLMKEPECAQFRYKDNWNLTSRALKKSDMALVRKVFSWIKSYQEFPMMWNAFKNGAKMFPRKSTNYLFATKDGVKLLQEFGLTKLPPAREMNGQYTYCNIAYVELY